MRRNREESWQKMVTQAEHYKAIGLTELSLMRDDMDSFGELWQYVTEGHSGGSHRLDIDTTYHFTAEHPCGLTFTWWFDLEDRDANGKGYYQIDAKGASKVLALLPQPARTEYQLYLRKCAEAVVSKADEWEQHTRRQRADAEILWELCGGKVGR